MQPRVEIRIFTDHGSEQYSFIARDGETVAAPLMLAASTAIAAHSPEVRRYARTAWDSLSALAAFMAKLDVEPDPTACLGCGRPNMGNCSAHLSDCPSYQALEAAQAAEATS